MMAYDWAECCAEVFSPNQSPQALAFGSPTISAIAPLAREKGWAAPLELIGQSILYEPGDFLYADEESLFRLCADLAQMPTPLRLARVRADSPVPAALTAAYRGKGIVLCRPAAPCPWIALDRSWEHPERHINVGRQSDLRRARRHAEGRGGILSEIITPKPRELGLLLDEAFTVEASGWKGRNGTALLHDRKLGTFFRRYAEAACESRCLRIARLKIGGKAAAMQLAIETGNSYWLLKIGFDEEFARCSPGVLLLVDSIAYAAKRGLRSCEFMGVSDGWIRQWGTDEHQFVSLTAYPFSLAAGTRLVADTMAAVRSRLRIGLSRPPTAGDNACKSR
jgi:hypothetical protein